LLLLLVVTALVPAFAQERESGTRLEITAVDGSDFPELSLNLIATDVQSRPLESLEALRLRENGVPIADFQLDEVPVGLDLIFVLDAVGSQFPANTAGTAWLQTVQDAILRFSGRYLETGRDEVSLLVPVGEDGRWLVEDTTEPGALLSALDGYAPQPEQEPQTLALLARALASAQANAAPAATVSPDDPRARFKAIVLFTSAAGLDRYQFPPLVEEAQAIGVPIFVVAYGPEPAPTTLETLTWLYRPTRGAFAHLAAPDAADDLYEILAANGDQHRVQYRSKLQETGVYSVTISLHQAQDQLQFDLALAPPEVEIAWPETQIRRVGADPETELSALQPAVQSVPVRVTWPEGTPRAVVGAGLFLNGVPQPAQVTGAAPDLQFEWEIAALDAGEYTLTAQVTDTLGLVAESEPHPVTVSAIRPEPLPTPSPAPTATTIPVGESVLPSLQTEWINLIAAGTGGLFLLLVGVTVLFLRRRRPQPDDDIAPPPLLPEAEPLSARPDGTLAGAYLTLLGPETAGPEQISLPGVNVVLGRDADQVDIPLADSSVARLHARIRRRNGAYWLYDEGSASGTFLNFERLGLAPRSLADGDEIRLGRVRLRFFHDEPDEPAKALPEDNIG
jgi:hypothetical protein